MGLYEILKTSKLGAGAAPDMYTALLAQKISKGGSGGEAELSGVPPLTFRSNGTPLIDYLITGNTTQSGTPTPDNPIMPQGTGDLETVGAKAGQYKIPISSANTTTPVYLGEAQTTRRVKKLVFDGTENFTYRRGTPSSIFFIEIASTDYITNAALCSHYINTDTGLFDTMEDKHCLVAVSQYGTKSFIGFRDTSYTSDSAGAKDFKTYLAQQYAAGTPVTVWYAIATPTTGIVNEPLRKIGDYADTLSMEQAGVQIPTNKGSTTLDVLTTVKPSNVSIKYRV